MGFMLMKRKSFFLLLILAVLSVKVNAQKIYATSQAHGLTGVICIGCGVVNPSNSINNSDLTDYSLYTAPVLVSASVYQTLIFPTVNSNEGSDKLVIRIGASNTSLSKELFSGITIETFNGAISNNDVLGGINLIAKIELVENNSQAEIRLQPVAKFDRVKISLLANQAGSLKEYRNYYAYYEPLDTNPVSFGQLNITAQGNKAQLRWNTFSEVNNKEFIISRSNDGILFSELDRVEGNGTINSIKNYTYNDDNPLKGTSYYRLQQVDLNGEITTLKEAVLRFNVSDMALNVYPNPSSGLINISFESGKYNSFVLLDYRGKKMQECIINATMNNLTINLDKLSYGVYSIHLLGDNVFEVRRVLKQ